MKMPAWQADMQIKQSERKVVDALAMYAAAFAEADEVTRDLSAARMREMIRGSRELREAFSVPVTAPREDAA